MSIFFLETKNIEILGLRPILNDILLFVNRRFGLNRFTDMYRKDGYASDGRHADMGCRNHVVGRHIAEEVNRHWQYDPERPRKPVAMWHDVGQGPHIHFQCHDRTVRIL